jgi:Protein of unknown function (DUF1631)
MIPAAQDIPLTASVISGIRDKFSEGSDSAPAAEALSLEELLAYLRSIDDFSLPLIEAIRIQTEAIGDPAAPAGEQFALLAWLDEAWAQWEQRYSLAEPLLLELRQLRPVAGALALTDSDFHIPGRHPLHRLLDVVQDSAVGWQASLGRAGEALASAVETAVKDARAWLNEPTTDLEAICTAVTTLAQRDQTRAKRMSQRAVETEAGREKSSAARSGAANMINRCLEGQALPEAIGNFVKGDWYDSAQLVLLKFGEDSEQWQQMQETTVTLVESVQAYDPEDGDRRKQLFELATQLPKNMRNWLLSLQHDGDAVAESLGLVEFVHLRLLRQQELERQTIDPIPVAEDNPSAEDEAATELVNSLRLGQWLRIERDGKALRVQFALNNSAVRQLMFTNRSGVKSLVLGYGEFAELVAQQHVRHLSSGAGFSRCLAHCAGIDNEAAVQQLREQETRQQDMALARERDATAEQQKAELAAQQQREEAEAAKLRLEEQRAAEEQARQRQAEEQASRDKASAELLARQRAEAEQLAREQAAAAAESPLLDLSAKGDDTTLEDVSLDLSADDNATLDLSLDLSADDNAALDLSLDLSADDNAALDLSLDLSADDNASLDTVPDDDVDLSELARQAADQLVADVETGSADNPPAEQDSVLMTLGDEAMQAKILQERQLQERVETTATDLVPPPEPPPLAQAAAHNSVLSAAEIQLTMGAWLGFHDGDTPIMARLAVHDREQGSYIFVNRQGIKLRQLSTDELTTLIDQGQVELLETRSNFREAVRRARDNQDD